MAFAGALGTDTAMLAPSKELRMSLGSHLVARNRERSGDKLVSTILHALLLRKLEAYASLDPLALERRCRNRGLWTHSGTDQLPPSKSTLLQRLRLFESYWNHARAPKLSPTSTSDVLLEGREVTNNSVMDDIDGTPIEPLASADLHQRRRNLGDQFSGLRRSLLDLSLMLHIVLRT